MIAGVYKNRRHILVLVHYFVELLYKNTVSLGSCPARYVEMTFDPAQIDPSDASAAMLSLARSEAGRDVVWNHLMDNWKNNTVPPGYIL